ncbi:hypothetical protein [Lysobacter sp. CFH 32150]|uniref:hypothetical protein n=1 Tax=Lysobacter sp. CFH 32150 TaxID=2927128 RepID=UPI001FA7381B|nr:hypothetical protein [Lysobacter sp. CFH 32150]MCI4568478.1 hypothetical protein [Lysobacter sp. CFH 32150]
MVATCFGNAEVIVDFDRDVEQPVVAYTSTDAVEEDMPQHHEQEDLGIGHLLQRAAHELQCLDGDAREQVIGLVRLAAGEVSRTTAQGRIRCAPSAFEQLVRLRPVGRHAATTGGRPLLCWVRGNVQGNYPCRVAPRNNFRRSARHAWPDSKAL